MADPSALGRPAAAAGRPTAIRHAFAATGPEGAPTLVLLHGTRRTRAMWRHQLAGLADAFRVVAVDLPGHGALADVPFRLADASALVGHVIDDAGGGRAVVVGQSLGGYVGLDLASRRPDQVAGLVLANATAEPRTIARRAPGTVGTYLLGAATERIRARGTGGDHGQPPDARDPEEPGAGWTESGATNGWLFKGGTRAMVAALRETFIPRLAAYPGPTLLINGEDDRLFRRSEQAFLAAAVNGRLEVIPGCAHLVNEERPAAFNAAVRRFAAEVFGPDVLPGPA
jgi:pimeloyl-ACP methyl ester carboxylesterase